MQKQLSRGIILLDDDMKAFLLLIYANKKIVIMRFKLEFAITRFWDLF